MSVQLLIRPDLRLLKPYSSARNEFIGNGDVWLDANENPSATPWNRYPDPLQCELKTCIAGMKEVSPDQLMLGNGSDEVLDLIFRLVGRPFEDTVAFPDPSYGMYEVLARINGLTIKQIQLDQDFNCDPDEVIREITGTCMLIVCRPNNPTGNLMKREELIRIIRTFSGVVVVDEAYIDFCPEESMANLVGQFSNLIVVQTLSKAYGMAGLRIGMAIANPEWIDFLNTIKPPYNLSSLVQETALKLLKATNWEQNRTQILEERERLYDFLKTHPLIKEVFPSETNFILFRVENADAIYNYLVENGVVIRNRSRQFRCENTLRISIGSVLENNRFMQLINALL